LNEFTGLMRIKTENVLMKNFVKWADLLKVAYELPVFYYNPPKLTHKQLECGYEVERRLFPRLASTNTVFEKDYKLIK
jgi:hypothetical protein